MELRSSSCSTGGHLSIDRLAIESQIRPHRTVEYSTAWPSQVETESLGTAPTFAGFVFLIDDDNTR
jgi:hypothetical protein